MLLFIFVSLGRWSGTLPEMRITTQQVKIFSSTRRIAISEIGRPDCPLIV